MNIRTLSVLMWKHGVVRIRRFIHTAVDIVAPIVLLVFLYLLKDVLSGPERPGINNAVGESRTEIHSLENEAFGIVLYHPKSNFTDALMKEVGRKLNLKEIEEYKNGVPLHGVYGYASKAVIDVFPANMTYLDAVVMFENMTENVHPKKLNYGIRMKQGFGTDGYEAADTDPHRNFGTDYYRFMRLQWVIDSSYIEGQSNKRINQALHVQEFPYFRSPKKTELAIICKNVIPSVCLMSLLLTFVFYMCRQLEERTSGIQELTKMVGVSFHSLAVSHFLNVVPVGLVFSILGAILLKISSNPLVPHTNGFLIFLILFLYFDSIVALAFLCSYIIKSSDHAVSISVVAHVILSLPAQFLINSENLTYIVVVLSGLLPHMPMIWFWNEVAVTEVYGIGVTFSNMFASSRRDNISVFLCFGYLIAQCFWYYLLAWYFSLVRPGKYGQALPWNFLFKYANDMQKQTWTSNEVAPDADSDKMELIDQEYFEQPPDDLKVGIRVENVTKTYPKHNALNDVSLKAYQGEITVLVGHNGAGKTTLMSIITGMTSATRGKVYVKDFDSVKQKVEVRKLIGLCPQHNMFFPDLTLQQHIMFFTMLKRGTLKEAYDSSVKLAMQLGLEDKLSELCGALSGGMKRRAQLACALAGGADVLVLDEPTSGLDVETRRELWDLLLSLRGERTVLLSTHFMEEADALGDRVAALHAGELRCFATTMHLKRAVGKGYRVSLTTIGLPKESEITEEVLSHVSDASVKEKTINSISYNLPATAHRLFPQLFSSLENKKPELGIDSIGVGVSTLEEVFLKLCSDVDTTAMEPQEVESTSPVLSQNKLTGFSLYWRQFCVLMKRQVRFFFYRIWLSLIMQVILPIILICGLTYIMNNYYAPDESDKLLPINLNMYSKHHAKVLYNVQPNGEHIIRNLESEYPGVRFEKTDDVADYVLRVSREDAMEYNKYIAGIELNETDAKILFTTTVRHAAPVALNLLSDILAMRSFNEKTSQIHTYNHPIAGYVRHTIVTLEPKYAATSIIWAIAIVFFIQATILHCVSLPCRERETGSRHVHIMSGCPPELHWSVTLLFHMTLTALFVIVPSIIAASVLDADNTINQTDFLVCFAVILLVGSLAMMALMYLVSFRFSERNVNIVLVVFLFIFGLVCPIIKAGSEILHTDDMDPSITQYLLVIANYIMPPYAMMMAMFQSVLAARANAWCELSRAHCPNTFIVDILWKDSDNEKCCGGLKPRCYFCLSDSSPMVDIILLIAQFVVLMIMVFLTERGVFNGLFDWLLNLKYKTEESMDTDQRVRAEKTYVEHEITKPPRDINNDSMLVDNIHKNYPAIIRKSCNAVRGVSFSVKKGECFGLLGVNGAGKSTTFKMLTAEECTTRGKIFGNGYHLRAGTSKYLQTLGYCPQFFGLDLFLTGEENLELVLTLEGMDAEQVKEEVKAWIEIVGLQKYARRQVATYSGGCARRVCAAAALCGRAALALLDEPSAGVDVAARRRLWAALRRALRQRRAVVISSHSMDEMESLCGRVAVLCAGRVRALGAPAELRAAHAAGHAVIFKVKHAAAADEVDGAIPSLNMLKGKLREKFNCDLKDEHKTMLHYHINETMRYSELFTQLEALRSEFANLIEDYSVTETTLEEVFLALAKENKTGPAAV